MTYIQRLACLEKHQRFNYLLYDHQKRFLYSYFILTLISVDTFLQVLFTQVSTVISTFLTVFSCLKAIENCALQFPST